MRIAVPTNGTRGKDEAVAEHFGRCRTFTILDESGEVVEVIENTSQHMGGTGLPPELLKKHKVDVLLCPNLGPNAIRMCEQFGIRVFMACGSKAEDLFKEWKDKKAKAATLADGCEDHKH
ncbi:NifB/NifX family molybdenum-iron cluster-binding protein [Candidatus Woesearchaeota archaeon]|nr:NifB/NifX family molybdenum-iron cluster-binding protein [Candidatus Woesearchaeota archaeon]